MSIWDEAAEAIFADANFTEKASFNGSDALVIRSKMAQGETLTEFGASDTANFTLHVRKHDVVPRKNMTVDFDGTRYYIDTFELDSGRSCWIITLKSGRQA